MTTNKAPIKKENGISAPDGFKEVKCAACGDAWYVPEDVIQEDTAFVCPLCSQSKADAISDTKAAAEAALKG